MNSIKKIFKRENILVLSLILVAFLGIFGIPQILGINAEQIILLLFGVLALDMLIERLGYLDRIENKLAELASKIQPIFSVDSMLLSREKMGSFEEQLIEGDNIWIASRTLHAFMKSYVVSIQKAAQKGKKFRFLIVNPENLHALESIAVTRVESNVSFLSSSMAETLSLILLIQKKAPKNSVQIKVVDFIPLNMIRVVDPHKETGEMIIEHYGYKVSTGQRRHFIVNKKRDPETFSFYLDQFEQMWNDGKYV